MFGENTVITEKLFNTLNLSGKKIKEKNKKKHEKINQNIMYNELKQRLYQTKQELNAAIDNFNSVTDPKLTDVYIYKIRSEETRYEHILKEIKNKYIEMELQNKYNEI